jgi:hypothetical protein
MTNDEQRQVAFSLKKKANGERENNPVDDDDDSSSSPFQRQRLRRRRRKPLLRKVVREDFSLPQIPSAGSSATAKTRKRRSAEKGRLRERSVC